MHMYMHMCDDRCTTFPDYFYYLERRVFTLYYVVNVYTRPSGMYKYLLACTNAP